MNVSSIVSSVRAQAASIKSASVKAAGVSDPAPDVKDPNNKGTVKAPNHPDGDDRSKTQLPADGQNKDKGTDMAGKDVTKPSGTGEHVPAVSKTEKCASATAALADELRKLASAPASADTTKSASAAPAATGAAPAAAKSDAAPAGTTKSAGADAEFHPEVSYAVFQKLAHTLLSTEEGTQMVKRAAARVIGEEQALALINGVNAEAEQLAALEKRAAVEEAQTQNLALVLGHCITKSASEKRDQGWIKQAFVVHAHNLDSIVGQTPEETLLLKAAYVQGVEDAGAMAADPAAADPAAAELPGAEGEVPPEQILALIEQLVASGQLDEQMAMELVQQLGLANAPAEAGGAPEEVAPEAVKAASVVLQELFVDEPAKA